MSTNESFISHLLELRTRLLYAFGGLLLVFICLVPWAGELYALLAEPMLAFAQLFLRRAAVRDIANDREHAGTRAVSRGHATH